MRLQQAQGGQHVCTLVEKHGGDAFHFSAPEKSTLEILHLVTSNRVRAETLMQLSFTTHTLKVCHLVRSNSTAAPCGSCTGKPSVTP